MRGWKKNGTDVPRGREPLSAWYARGKKYRRACRGQPSPRAGPARLTRPFRSGSKCRAAQQPLNLPANSHRPPPSQAQEATCLACIALEASGLGNLGRQGQQARVSAQGHCLTASGSAGRSKYAPIGCALLRWRPPTARRQTISAFEHLILLGLVLYLPQTQITKYHKGP